MANSIAGEYSAAGHNDATSKNKIALVSLAVLYFMLGFITCLNDTLVN